MPKIAKIHVLKHGQNRPYLKSGFPPSPSWEAGDCSHLPPMAYRATAMSPGSWGASKSKLRWSRCSSMNKLMNKQLSYRRFDIPWRPCDDTVMLQNCRLQFSFFKVFICQIFYINTLTILHFTQQISKLRTQSRHYPNPIATNGAGVCQYDITNATANYNTVSMTTLGHQFKDKTDNHSTVNAPYVQQKNGKRGQETSKGLWAP